MELRVDTEIMEDVQSVPQLAWRLSITDPHSSEASIDREGSFVLASLTLDDAVRELIGTVYQRKKIVAGVFGQGLGEQPIRFSYGILPREKEQRTRLEEIWEALPTVPRYCPERKRALFDLVERYAPPGAYVLGEHLQKT